MTATSRCAGVKVLDLGILIPAALTSGKLAALGADVVKVEQPPLGDRVRVIPPFGDDGESPQHMGQNWGKRSIGLDVREPTDRAVHRSRSPGKPTSSSRTSCPVSGPGRASTSPDCARSGPQLIVCSVTGFGQTGPWASLPSHGLNMDALGDTLQHRMGGRAAPPRLDLHQLGQRTRHRLRGDGDPRRAGRPCAPRGRAPGSTCPAGMRSSKATAPRSP